MKIGVVIPFRVLTSCKHSAAELAYSESKSFEEEQIHLNDRAIVWARQLLVTLAPGDANQANAEVASDLNFLLRKCLGSLLSKIDPIRKHLSAKRPPASLEKRSPINESRVANPNHPIWALDELVPTNYT